ncbi:hypothetical protein [Roseibium sp. MB-4]
MRVISAAPFIGYIILFNDHTVSFVNNVFTELNIYNTNTGIHRNLYLFYFGTIFLGVGSILFTFRCPAPQKRADSDVEYSSLLNQENSLIITYNNLDFLLERYSKVSDEITNSISFPETIELNINRLIIEIVNTLPQNTYLPGQKLDECDDQLDEEPEELGDGIFFPNGTVNAAVVAQMVYMSPRVLWAFTQEFKQHARQEFASDIHVTTFQLENYADPISRFLTFFAFSFGFILLLIPSADVFFKIVHGLIFTSS